MFSPQISDRFSHLHGRGPISAERLASMAVDRTLAAARKTV
jgi:hypothetical protein